MKTRPDFGSFVEDNDHVRVHVEVAIPWTRERLAFDHILDTAGMREEFRPLPESCDPFDYHRRRELLDKRERTVDMVAKTVARSILVALAKEDR